MHVLSCILRHLWIKTTTIAQLVECPFRMWEVVVQILTGSYKGSDCSFVKYSVKRVRKPRKPVLLWASQVKKTPLHIALSTPQGKNFTYFTSSVAGDVSI